MCLLPELGRRLLKLLVVSPNQWYSLLRRKVFVDQWVVRILYTDFAGLGRSLFVRVVPTPNPDSLKFVTEGEQVLTEDQGTGRVRGRPRHY